MAGVQLTERDVADDGDESDESDDSKTLDDIIERYSRS